MSVRLLLLVTLAWMLPVSPTLAITFNLEYRGSDSQNPHPLATSRPDDPGGTLLSAHVAQAASDWADVIEDNYSMTIHYFYESADSLPGETTTAVANTVTQIAVNAPVPNRTLLGELKFSAEKNFWFDPTPADDSDFSFTQTVLNDLSQADRAAGFVEGPAGAGGLENGYLGVGNPGGIDSGQTDLLSAARHELGHLMGFNRQIDFARAVVDSDGVWDLVPGLIDGRTVGAVAARTGNNGDTADSHFLALNALLSSQLTVGKRRSITATDVLGAAFVGNWTQLDLPRRNYLRATGGTSDFANAANWIGNRAPDPDHEVFIRSGDLASVIVDTEIKSLMVDHDSDVDVILSVLDVDQAATIGKFSLTPIPGRVLVAGGTLTARSVTIEAGSLALSAGTVRSRLDLLINKGLISGNGHIDAETGLFNDGTLRPNTGTLRITGTLAANPVVDLDGSRTGIVDASNGNLDVQIANSPSFRGSMIIGAGQFIDLPDAWRLELGGTLNLNGSASRVAELRGGNLTVRDDLEVDRLGSIEGSVTVGSLGHVQLPDADDTLTIGGGLELDQGRISGAGTVIVSGETLATQGSITAGELHFQDSTEINGASVSAAVIDATGVRFTQAAGTLAFEEFFGELDHAGGVIEVGSNEAKGSVVDGKLTQRDQSELGIEIASATDFSQLIVQGLAEIDGVINVTLVGGYSPVVGEEFDVLIAGDLDIDSLALTGTAASRFVIDVQGGDTIVLEALSAVVGDYNGDGVVNGVDYAVWRDSLGASGTGLAADGNNDGQIDGIDYRIWQNNYGAGAEPGSIVVPEPASLTCLLLGLATLLARRCQKRQLSCVPVWSKNSNELGFRSFALRDVVRFARQDCIGAEHRDSLKRLLIDSFRQPLEFGTFLG